MQPRSGRCPIPAQGLLSVQAVDARLAAVRTLGITGPEMQRLNDTVRRTPTAAR